MNLIDKLHLIAARERGYLELMFPDADISLDLAGTDEAIETVRAMQEALKNLEEAARRVQAGEWDVHSIDLERREAREALRRAEGNEG